MTPQFRETDLDCEVVFDCYLGTGDALDVLQEALVALAPGWTSKLRIWRGPRDQRPIDTGRQGSLRDGIMAAAGERGTTYRALVDRYGIPPLERLAGSVELRGSGSELVVVVSVDKMVVSPLGAKQQLGNNIDFQVRGPKVGRSSGDTWLRDAFEFLCARLSPAWGWAGHPREYWAKVMSDTPPVDAVGRDFGRFLPGVFWLNFFGRRCRELIGDDRLRSAPAERVAVIDDGVLIVLADDPAARDTPSMPSENRGSGVMLARSCSSPRLNPSVSPSSPTGTAELDTAGSMCPVVSGRSAGSASGTEPASEASPA